MGGRSSTTDRVDELLAALSRRQGRLVDAYMRELVPGYTRALEPKLGDMREAAQRTIAVILAALLERRELTAQDIDFFRPYFRHALLRGASQAELVRSARIWHRVITRSLEELADDVAVAHELSPLLLHYIDLMGDAAVVAVEEIAQAQELTGRESRRTLVKDLLAGMHLSGDALGLARACGLGNDRAYVVVSGRATGEPLDEAALAVAAVALARSGRDAVEPLFALCDDEVVVVRPVGDGDLRPYVEHLEAARTSLATEGTALAVGVSARRTGLDGARAAHGEAVLAREKASAQPGGVVALPLLGPLDYLFLRGGDETAWSLVPERIRDFIDADLGQAGLLVETLVAYIGSSLNVKAAAEALFVHPNTAHYRLAKIETLTGRDLRNLDDLQELVVAVRLARHRRGLGD